MESTPPRDPGRPNPSVSTGAFSWDRGKVVTVVLVVLGAIALAVALSKVHWGHKDKREVRRFGNLECVYNVETDEIESCVKVTG